MNTRNDKSFEQVLSGLTHRAVLGLEGERLAVRGGRCGEPRRRRGGQVNEEVPLSPNPRSRAGGDQDGEADRKGGAGGQRSLQREQGFHQRIDRGRRNAEIGWGSG